MPKNKITLHDITKLYYDPDALWEKLVLESISSGTPIDPTCIHICDIAKVAGADIALQCSQALDWSDVRIRQLVVGLLIRWIQRSYKNIDDVAILSDINLLSSWVVGDEPIDLQQRSLLLQIEIMNMPSKQHRTSDEIVMMYIWMLMGIVQQRWESMSKWVNWGATVATMVGTRLISEAESDSEEQQQQIVDIIALFS
jgi:hypothetical protein